MIYNLEQQRYRFYARPSPHLSDCFYRYLRSQLSSVLFPLTLSEMSLSVCVCVYVCGCVGVCVCVVVGVVVGLCMCVCVCVFNVDEIFR